MMERPERQTLLDFVYTEASLLDEQRFDEWLELFSEDARYWMPLSPGQKEGDLHASLMDEDKLLLRVRIERLKGRRTYSQQPASRSHHLLQQPVLQRRDDDQGIYLLRTAFHYVETRQDEQQLFAGWVRHELRHDAAGLLIRLKRVDLVNCDAAHGSIQLFM